MMRNLRKSLLLVFVSSLFISAVFSQTDSSKTDNGQPFVFNGSYKGEVVTNYDGGIKPGTNYLGLANLKMGFDTRKAGLWGNGFLFINAENTHGGVPSGTLVGDFQSLSNIEAGNHSFLYELWYRQSIQNVTFIVGLQDLNSSFAVVENGNLFVNSSFGLLSTISNNIPASIFPHTALGITAQWNISADYEWQAALYDGTPDNFKSSPFNTNWKLSRSDGVTLISEFNFEKSIIKGMKGSYKLGTYYHTDAYIKTNYGIYLIADQQVIRKRNDSIGLSLFSQIGLCPRDKNINDIYYSLGATYKGVFNLRPGDEVGVAIAHAGFSQNVVRYETALEMYYRFKVSPRIIIKPDLQYIINPAGTFRKLPNAFVSLLRMEVNF